VGEFVSPAWDNPASKGARQAHRCCHAQGKALMLRRLKDIIPHTGMVLAVILLACAGLSARFLGNGKNVQEAKTAESAAAPDFSGVWMGRQSAITFTSKEPPLQPWAEAKFRTVKPGYGPRATPDSEDPILACAPPGVPRIMLIPFPMQIVQIPGEVIMIFEYDHFVRQIFLDRREHLKGIAPTWMGDSIGHWEGDTLVIDTSGFNDKTWLDQVGHPHSDALHLIERIRRPDHDTLVDDLTIDDPKTYTRPWSGQQVFKLRPGWHLLEYVCEDNMAQQER
jgi:hypothetical protein